MALFTLCQNRRMADLQVFGGTFQAEVWVVGFGFLCERLQDSQSPPLNLQRDMDKKRAREEDCNKVKSRSQSPIHHLTLPE